jgi:hypothetical protein
MKTILLVCLLGLSAAAGCNAIDRASDCSAICSRYRDCFNSAYDNAACASRCRDNAANSTSYDNKVDICRDCINSRSCVASAFNCGSECSGVVP